MLVSGPGGQAGAEERIVIDAGATLNSGCADGARLGINVDYWEDHPGRRSEGALPLGDALRSMGVTRLRYPGGSKSDVYRWSVPPYGSPEPRLALIGPTFWPSNSAAFWTPPGDPAGGWSRDVMDFDQFMAVCAAAGARPNIVVAYGSAHKAQTGEPQITLEDAVEMAAAWVAYANVVKGYGVMDWEIGNETWLDDYANKDPGRSRQAEDLVLFSRAMKAVDPTIRIGTNAGSKEDFRILLSKAASDIDFLAVHAYPAYGLGTYASYQETDLRPLEIVDAAYAALAEYPGHRDRIKIVMTEMSGMTYASWRAADLGHALMTFELFARVLQDPRVEYSEYWNTRWIDPNLAEAFALDQRNGFTAQGWALYVLGKFVLDRMVVAEGTRAVPAFASLDAGQGTFAVFLVNKSPERKRARVEVRHGRREGTGEVFALRGAGFRDTNPVFGRRGTADLSDATFTIDLDPVSITVIRFGS